jgi:hypothetical protein
VADAVRFVAMEATNCMRCDDEFAAAGLHSGAPKPLARLSSSAQ